MQFPERRSHVEPQRDQSFLPCPVATGRHQMLSYRQFQSAEDLWQRCAMTTFTRQQLYDLVWEKPTVQVAKQIGVSDVAIAKACKRHQIPKPPLGYWAMLQHGKKVDRVALPEVGDPSLARVSFEPLSPDDCTARADKVETDANAEQLNVPVPGVLQSPH